MSRHEGTVSAFNIVLKAITFQKGDDVIFAGDVEFRDIFALPQGFKKQLIENIVAIMQDQNPPYEISSGYQMHYTQDGGNMQIMAIDPSNPRNSQAIAVLKLKPDHHFDHKKMKLLMDTFPAIKARKHKLGMHAQSKDKPKPNLGG